RPRLLAVGLDGALAGAVAGLAPTLVGSGQPAPDARFDGIVLGGPVDPPRLVELAARLAPEGRPVMADPRPGGPPPPDHAPARRHLFLAAGLEPYREPPPRGRGVIEAAAWTARRASTDERLDSP